MSKADYSRLIDELCKLTNIKKTKKFDEVADIRVDEIPFAITHGGADNDNSMMIYCEFGEPPKHLGGAIFQRLLEANSIMIGPGRPSFGLNHLSGKILLSVMIPTTHATGEILIQVLKHYAKHAKEWRETHFLLDTERNPSVRSKQLRPPSLNADIAHRQ
jgi:hypothetical protein